MKNLLLTGKRIESIIKISKTTWKRKIQKYRYHKNKNKKRIPLTDEQ
jgi:hypothetical protein